MNQRPSVVLAQVEDGGQMYYQIQDTQPSSLVISDIPPARPDIMGPRPLSPVTKDIRQSGPVIMDAPPPRLVMMSRSVYMVYGQYPTADNDKWYPFGKLGCGSGSVELPSNCGRGGQRCPEGYTCNSDPADRFAVCVKNSPCKDKKCGKDEHCELKTYPCLVAPCPQGAVCVKNKGPCGGRCGENQVCVKQDIVCVTTPCDPIYTCTDICDLPKEPGRCKAYIPSWYYNSEAGQCEEFIYGGCGGNANNFRTKADCKKATEYCRRK